MLNFLYLLDMVHSHNHLSSMNQEHSYLVWLTPWKNAHRTARMTEGQIPLRKSLLSKHHCHNDAGWKPLKFERQYIEWQHSGKLRVPPILTSASKVHILHSSIVTYSGTPLMWPPSGHKILVVITRWSY